MEKDRHSIECLSFFLCKNNLIISDFEVREREFMEIREFREFSEFREKPYRPYYPYIPYYP